MDADVYSLSGQIVALICNNCQNHTRTWFWSDRSCRAEGRATALLWSRRRQRRARLAAGRCGHLSRSLLCWAGDIEES
jgi:hypothetical protein